ncbi:hypothetical protein [Mycobacterium sp.]|jgi:hypothetical protein|uniref:hypothetical protein n=1 Tax=Mycobacterium sp. TaxID=1785 RepID=UPI0025FBD1C2|nr:hypothetical protein [Mycobacterium sp.]
MDDLDAEFLEIIATVGPRRCHIVAAAEQLAIAIRAEADQLDTAPIDAANQREFAVLGSLPPQTFTQSRLWRYQLANAAEVLAGDTRRWGAPVPRCTGEEMMLHLILRRAAADAGCPPQQLFAWPDDPARQHGWGDLFENLFQDNDVLMLYDAAKHGRSDLGGVNMNPPQWFSEFSLPYPVPSR